MGKARLIIAVVLAGALSGCVPFWMIPKSQPQGNLCSLGPFTPDAGFEQRWTDSEKMRALTENESGADICGWTTE